MEFETVPALIVTVLTLLSPLISAFFTKLSMSPKTKNLIALGISLVIAVIYVILTGGFADVTGVEDVAVPLGIVYGLQQVVYNQFMRKHVAKVEAKRGVTDRYKPKHRAVG